MKIKTALVLLSVTTMIVALTGPSLGKSSAEQATQGWICPPCGHVDDDQVYSESGRCPICDMELVSLEERRRTADQRLKAAILIFDGVQIIDYTGPYEVFGQARFDVFTVSESGEAITTSMGMSVNPTHSFESSPTPDLLLVPGGDVHAQLEDPEVLKWVQLMAAEADHVLSVCNGAFILAEAGLLEGDIILAIDGTETRRWEDVSSLIRNSEGREVVLTLQRGDLKLDVSVTPRMEKTKNLFGEEVGERYLIGIARSEELIYEKVGFIKSLQAGVSQTWSWMYLTVMGLIKIIQKVIPASELGGPILIAKIAGERMEAGWINFLYFMGVLSVNLGILNLLPIPILDGGHLVFFSVEAILRKPLNLRTMEILQQVGLVLRGTLLIFVVYNDLVRVFG